MPDDITFTDIVAIIKIKPDTTVEKYGGLINSSLFDAANVLGTLSQKKLISFTTAMPGQNPIMLTEAGKNLMTEADSRAEGEFDHLDLTILQQMQNGMNAPADIAKAINISPRDLAMHLYKMMKQGYSTYEFRSGIVSVMLTEKGFAQAKAGMPQKVPPAPAQQPPSQTGAPALQQQFKPPQMPMQPAMETTPIAPPPQQQMGGQTASAPPQEKTAEQIEAEIKAKKSRKTMLIAVVVLVIIVVVAGALYYTKVI